MKFVLLTAHLVVHLDPKGDEITKLEIEYPYTLCM